MPRVMTFDVATRTGVAWDGPDEGAPMTSLIRAPSPEGSQDEGWDFGRTFSTYRDELTRLIVMVRPEIIGYEAPLNIVHGDRSKVRTNQNTIRVLFGLAGITEMVIFDYAQMMGPRGLSVRSYECNVQQVKKHFAGTGRADKQMMMARCRQLGWEYGGDDNRADAAAQWSFLKALTDPKWAPRSTPLFRTVGAA